MIVYTYDPKTRKYAGQSRVQQCQRTGKLLRPQYCFDTPPPMYPDCIVVIAGEDGWVVDLPASKTSATSQIHRLHAEALRNLTGHATLEERDTWAPKVQAAQAVVDAKASQAQSAMIGLEAQGKGITATDMAHRVIKNSGEFEVLCGMAAAFRAKSIKAIASAKDAGTLVGMLENLKVEMNKAISAVKG